MNIDELADKLSRLPKSERKAEQAEIFAEMREEFGEEADAKIQELKDKMALSTSPFQQFEKALKSVTIKTKSNKTITKSTALKSKLPANIRLFSSTQNPEKDIPALERNLEVIQTGLRTVPPTTPADTIIQHNVDVLLDAIDETKAYAITGQGRAKAIKIDSLLGGIPLGPVENRDVIYKYWEDVAGKYKRVQDTLDFFLGEPMIAQLEQIFDGKNVDVEWDDISSNLLEFKGKDLSYVHRFDAPEVDMEEPLGMAYSYIVSLETTYNLHKEMLEEEKRETGEIAGDINSQMQMELRTASKVSYGQDLSMLDPSLTNTSDDDDLKNLFRNKFNKVDPLLAYYYNSPKSNLSKKIVAVTRKGFEDISDFITGFVENTNAQYSDMGVVMAPKIKRDIKEFTDTLKSDRDEFYLPHSVIDVLPKDSKVDGKDNIGDILEFLNAVGDLLFEFPPMLPSKTARRQFGVDTEGLPSDAPMIPAHKGKMKKVRESFKDLLEAIDDYYITPSYSGKLPIAEVDFVKSSGAFKISAGSSNLGVQSLSGTAYAGILNNRFNVKKRHIEAIYNFLNSVVSGDSDLDMKLTQMGEDAAKALTELFDLEEQNNNHMAAIISYVYGEMGQEVGDRKFDKKLISERTKQYETDYASGKAFPLFILPSYLMKHKGLIERSGMKNAVSRLKDLLRRVEDLPVILKSLLKAHDIVREIKGLKPVYAFRPLTITHSEEVINKMYSEFSVDLSHSEVDKIVTEVNSFSNIAKSLGVSEEIVYQVKAQFR